MHMFLHIYPLIAKAQVNAYVESASNGICINHASKYPFYAKPTLRMAHSASQAHAETLENRAYAVERGSLPTETFCKPRQTKDGFFQEDETEK